MPDVYSRIRECLYDWKRNAIRFYPTCHIELPLQPTLWVSPSCVQMLFLLLRDSEHVPYILPLSSKDSVVVGLGREEAAFLKMDSSTLTFTTWMRSLRNDLQSKSFTLARWQKQDCFHVETCGNTNETSSAAAEPHKPRRSQSKAPDVSSRIRECLYDWKCNAIRFYPTWHMNAFCHQRSGCLLLCPKVVFAAQRLRTRSIHLATE